MSGTPHSPAPQQLSILTSAPSTLVALGSEKGACVDHCQAYLLSPGARPPSRPQSWPTDLCPDEVTGSQQRAGSRASQNQSRRDNMANPSWLGEEARTEVSWLPRPRIDSFCLFSTWQVPMELWENTHTHTHTCTHTWVDSPDTHTHQVQNWALSPGWWSGVAHVTMLTSCLAFLRFEMDSTWHWGPEKVKVFQSCPTLHDPMDYTVHGILQARILEWVDFPFSRGSSQPRGSTQVFQTEGRFFNSWATREAQEYWSG